MRASISSLQHADALTQNSRVAGHLRQESQHAADHRQRHADALRGG